MAVGIPFFDEKRYDDDWAGIVHVVWKILLRIFVENKKLNRDRYPVNWDGNHIFRMGIDVTISEFGI